MEINSDTNAQLIADKSGEQIITDTEAQNKVQQDHDKESTDSGFHTDSDIGDEENVDLETRMFLKGDFSSTDITKEARKQELGLAKAKKQTYKKRRFSSQQDDAPEAMNIGIYEKIYSRRDRKCHGKFYTIIHFANVSALIWFCYLVGGIFDLLDSAQLKDAEPNVKIYALIQILIYVLQVTASSVALVWFQKSKLEATDENSVYYNKVYLRTLTVWILITIINACVAFWGITVIDGENFHELITTSTSALAADYQNLYRILYWLVQTCFVPIYLTIILLVIFFIIAQINYRSNMKEKKNKNLARQTEDLYGQQIQTQKNYERLSISLNPNIHQIEF